ncbi:hypothetical protein ACFO0M_23665 [Micromonospora mangrovi]|uniref:Anti-sigma factor n=2 Tax=Micromonospora TaxID=1873 RepID=A0AAU8HB49_9ACTN
MTSGMFREVDHDLLADYLGGALDGTPEQATVARLVDEDPAWREAYTLLAPALDLVRADLADWAAVPAPELPLAVADRITAALAGAGPAPADVPQPRAADGPDSHDEEDPTAEPGVARQRRSGTPTVTVVGQRTGRPGRGSGTARPAEGPTKGTGPGRRQRRWARLAGPVALAAASIAAVGLGVNQLVGTAGGDGAPVTAQDQSAGNAARPLAAPFRTTGPPRRSGTDWTPERLSSSNLSMTEPGRTLAMVPPMGTAAPKSPQDVPQDEAQRLSVSGDLGRLAGSDALDSCLAAVAAEHAGGAVTVDLVDFASFQGRPALVLNFVDAAGARWAWVSGPECGVPGSGADTRFRTRVG